METTMSSLEAGLVRQAQEIEEGQVRQTAEAEKLLDAGENISQGSSQGADELRVPCHKVPARLRQTLFGSLLWAAPTTRPFILPYQQFPIFEDAIAPMTARYWYGKPFGDLDMVKQAELTSQLAQQVQRQLSGKAVEVRFADSWDGPWTDIDITFHHEDYPHRQTCQLSIDDLPLQYVASGPDFADNELIVQTLDATDTSCSKAMAVDTLKATLEKHATVLSVWEQCQRLAGEGETRTGRYLAHLRFDSSPRDHLPLDCVQSIPRYVKIGSQVVELWFPHRSL